MIDILQQPLESWAYFLLIFARTISVFAVAPIFGGRNVPQLARIGLSFLLSVLFASAMPMPEVTYSETFLLMLPAEVIIGIGIGFVSMLFFNAIQMAGALIDIPMGFSMVNVFDPGTDTQLPIMGDFYYVLAMLLYLATNAHHLLIRAMLDSFNWLSLGAPITFELLPGFSAVFMRMFLTGIRISIPAVGVMLMSDAALALLAKTVPSINAFIMGVPIKIALGTLAMFFSLGAFIIVATNLFHNAESGMWQEIIEWLGLIGGG